MLYEETVETFEEAMSQDTIALADGTYPLSRFVNSNGKDMFVFPNIPDYILAKARDAFALHVDEELLMVRDTSIWNKCNQGCVVTDWGITYIEDNNHPEKAVQIPWYKIENVEYSGEKIYFFLDETDRSKYFSIEAGYYFYCHMKDMGDAMAYVLKQTADTQYADSPEKICQRMDEYYEEKDYKNSIEEAKALIDSTDDVEYLSAAWLNIGLCYLMEIIYWDEKYIHESTGEEPFAEFDECVRLSWDAFEQVSKVDTDNNYDFFRGRIKELGTGEWPEARRLYISAMQDDDSKCRSNALECYREITNLIFNDFTAYQDESNVNVEKAELKQFTKSVSLHDRQFLLFARNEKKIAGYYDPDDNIKWVFTLDKIPADIQVEGGIPEADVLYLIHPQKSYIYVPYEKSEEMFFMDKVQEFCYLCQCLGAEKISFKSVKGKKVSEQDVATHSLDIDGNVKVVKGSVNAKQNSNRTSNTDRHDETELTQVFSPSTTPFCPEGLAWLESDSAWKMLLKQRLEGNILTYKYRIKSSETINITQSKKREIKASFQNLMNKVNANYDSTHDYTFNQHEETEWEISVVFRDAKLIGKDSINIVAAISTDILSESEAEYLNEYKEIIAGGEISDRDKRYLEKIKKSNGISDSRAKELEKMASAPSLSDEEQEYLNEYREMIADGAISERDRRFLDKIKRTNGISDDRASELEKMA